MITQSEATKDALQRDPDYQKYLKSLISANYFKGELEGSELWTILENRASLVFVQTRRLEYAFIALSPQCGKLTSTLSDTSRPSFASHVDAAATILKDLSEPLDRGEESDEWLNLDAENFDQILEDSRTKGKSKDRQDGNAMEVDVEETAESAEDRLASEQAKRLKDLANKVENFIEGEGDVEGAIFDE
jgi:hypothetical protein